MYSPTYTRELSAFVKQLHTHFNWIYESLAGVGGKSQKEKDERWATMGEEQCFRIVFLTAHRRPFSAFKMSRNENK